MEIDTMYRADNQDVENMAPRRLLAIRSLNLVVVVL